MLFEVREILLVVTAGCSLTLNLLQLYLETKRRKDLLPKNNNRGKQLFQVKGVISNITEFWWGK